MIVSIPPSSYLAEKSYQSAPSKPWDSISPGSDAIGSRLPRTLHSTSTPGTNSSISTFSSCWNASDRVVQFLRREGLEIPTDEPSRAGLTKTG